MLYILEGCDGTGKTTLAKWLSEVLNAEIIHCSTKTPNDYNFFCSIIEASKNRNLIADRFCYGQFVYQKEEERPLSKTTTVAYHALNEIELKLLKANAKVIFVDAPANVIKKRLSARQEELINDLTVEDIQSKFKELKRTSLLTWIEYNTGGEQ